MRYALPTLALAATLALSGACATQPDPEDMAEQALERWGIEGVEVDYDDDDKILRLKGTVPTEDVRQNAEESVRAAVGRNASITNEVLVEDTRSGMPPAAPTGQQAPAASGPGGQVP